MGDAESAEGVAEREGRGDRMIRSDGVRIGWEAMLLMGWQPMPRIMRLPWGGTDLVIVARCILVHVYGCSDSFS